MRTSKLTSLIFAVSVVFGVGGCAYFAGVENTLGIPSISSINLNGDVLTLKGTGLNGVNVVRIQGPSVTTNFLVTSQAATTLVAVAQSAAVLVIGTTYSLYLANSNGANTSASLTFSIQTGSVTSPMLASSYLQTSGGVMSGALEMNSSNILNVSTLSSSSVTLANLPSHLITYASMDSNGASFTFQKARGSAISETPFLASDTLGSILFQGEYGGTGPPGVWQNGALIQIQADSTTNSTASGNISFQVRHDGDAALTERLRINSTGVVAVNGSLVGSTGTLIISGNLAAGGFTEYPGLASPDAGFIDWGDGSGWRLNFTGNSKALSIASFYDSGAMVIGSASNTTNMNIYGDGLAAGHYCTWGSTAAGAVSCSSDRRLKNRVGNLEGALEKLHQIQGIYFKWKHPASKEDRTVIGVVAQDVQKVFPELITESKDPEHYLMLDHAGLVVPAIEGVKELNSKMDSREVRLNNHAKRLLEKGKVIAELKTRLEALEKKLR